MSKGVSPACWSFSKVCQMTVFDKQGFVEGFGAFSEVFEQFGFGLYFEKCFVVVLDSEFLQNFTGRGWPDLEHIGAGHRWSVFSWFFHTSEGDGFLTSASSCGRSVEAGRRFPLTGLLLKMVAGLEFCVQWRGRRAAGGFR